MDTATISFISALTALAASVLGPIVTLSVARRQFNANVLSANRQRWLETVRDTLAELASQVVGVVVIKTGRAGRWKDGFHAAAEDPEIRERIERLVFLFWRVRLLTNPNEHDHVELCRQIESILESLKTPGLDEAATRGGVERITTISQAILKRELERVKRGT